MGLRHIAGEVRWKLIKLFFDPIDYGLLKEHLPPAEYAIVNVIGKNTLATKPMIRSGLIDNFPDSQISRSIDALVAQHLIGPDFDTSSKEEGYKLNYLELTRFKESLQPSCVN